jgi:hypothetical protein
MWREGGGYALAKRDLIVGIGGLRILLRKKPEVKNLMTQSP